MHPIFAAIVLFPVVAASAHAGAPSFVVHDCPPAATSVGARCGTVQVPENHARPQGRSIHLNVLVLPATGPVRDSSRAQYDLEGGPGFAATDFLEFYSGEGAIYRKAGDIVLADMRGTGASNPLRCKDIEELEQRQPESLLYPPSLVAGCAQQLQQVADPRQYNTAAAARDIELIRRALGYQQLNLNAISYGTTLALRYMADFPGSVHSAVMIGTVPAARTPPRFHATAAQDAFGQLAASCAGDAACRSEFGDLRVNLHAALAHLDSKPGLPPAVFMEKLRTRLYSPAGSAGVPGLLSRAAQGDFNEFTKPVGPGRSFADGLYLSITCAESFANMDVPAAIAAARTTLFGAYRLERQSEACRHWPASGRQELPAQKTSQTPVLFIAGELDPVSPAQWAAETAVRFPRGTLVRVARGAHVFDGMSELDTCLDAVVLRFFAGGTRNPDTTCFSRMVPPPFAGTR